MSNRDIKILVDAVKRAMLDRSTRAIKRILRQGTHDYYIFPRDQDNRVSPMVTKGRVQLSTRNLFRLANTAVPETLYIRHLERLDFLAPLGNFLLHLAARISDYELVTLLLEKGANIRSVTPCLRTALHFACHTKCLKTVKLLAEKSPAYFLEMTDGKNETPLDIACQYSCPEVVEFLLSKCSRGLRRKKLRRAGPLLHAIANRPAFALPIASLLLDAAVDINHKRRLEDVALIAAIKKISTEATIPRRQATVDLCMLLIDRGCNVNVTDLFYKSALDLAVNSKEEILVRKLLFSGSYVDHCDCFGHTPLFYACRTRKQQIVDLLINFGANLHSHNWENILNNFDSESRKDHLFSYVLHKSRHCFRLEELCNMTIRKKVKNLQKDAVQLGLPPFLVKRLLLEE